MSKPIIDIDDPRLVKALAHPIRVRILGILESRSATPRELAAEIGLPLENVSYHVRTLKSFGFIKLERTRQVRGAIEHHYRAVARPKITAKAWEQMPDIVKHAMTSANLGQLSDLVNRAAQQGKFSRPESHLSRMPYVLDDKAFAQASQILMDALERIGDLDKEARQRIERGEADPLPTVALVMLFDEPDPAPLKPIPAKRRRTKPLDAGAARER
jgi:DNA-binding transcriptional ArsR family regulator